MARTIAVAERRRARRARSDGAARALHVRQRLLVHPAIGLESASIPRRRRSPRTSSGRERCCWPATGSPTSRRRRSSIPTIGRRGTSSSGRTLCIAACTSCSGCARFRRLRFWRAPSPRRSLLIVAANGAPSPAGEPSRWRSRGRSASISARCRRSEAGSRTSENVENGLLMRILEVVHGFPPAAQGGTELYAQAHARALRAAVRRRGRRLHPRAGSEPG